VTAHDQDENVVGAPVDPDSAPEEHDSSKRKQIPFWIELPILVLVALVVAVVIKTFLVQAFYIPSSSMEDTLQINDRVLVNKLAYRVSELGRGHVIVFDDPNGPILAEESLPEAALRNVAEAIGLSTPQSEFIKRVIALEGETVEVMDNTVYIDGIPIDEPYVKAGSDMPDYAAFTVPAGHVFVMGDNRDSSQDSRIFGPVATDEIVGRAFVIIWPPGRWGGL